MKPSLCCGLLAAVAAIAGASFSSAEQPAAPQKSGQIHGRVIYCGPGGVAGALVHIPGKSFQAKLGATGEFGLFWVPPGTHALVVEVPGRPAHTVENVVVIDNKVTRLGPISLCRDSDGDGFTEDQDCNDNNNTVHPGAAEPCDGFDNDCDGSVDEGCANCTDADNDGFFAQAGCGSLLDCDDADATVRPGALEACDSRDNDCDGQTDETFSFGTDPFNCGSCGTVCSFPNASAACANGSCEPAGCFGAFEDCNGDPTDGCETDVMTDRLHCGACQASCGPGQSCQAGTCIVSAVELCDGIDNDGDGLVDEGLVPPGLCSNQGVCIGLVATCSGSAGWTCNYSQLPDVDVDANGNLLPIELRCDGRDNNCNGGVDESFVTLGMSCDGFDGDLCVEGSVTCSPTTAGTVCSDSTPTSFERCGNGFDDDCDGQIDEPGCVP